MLHRGRLGIFFAKTGMSGAACTRTVNHPKAGGFRDIPITSGPMAVRNALAIAPAQRAMHMKSAFLKAGHLPTLISCFLYFDFSFAVWVLLGPLAVMIAQDLHLDAGQKGLTVAVPVLAGAGLRFLNGVLVGQWKPRLTGIVMQLVVITGLVTAWKLGIHTYGQILALGLVLGVAGASFAIALPMVSYWYPPEHQGIALGLAGAGNSGTVFASLFAPALAVAFGWRNVLGLVALPLMAVFILFVLAAKNSPRCPPRKTMAD